MNLDDKLGKKTMLIWVRTPLGATLMEQTMEEETVDAD